MGSGFLAGAGVGTGAGRGDASGLGAGVEAGSETDAGSGVAAVGREGGAVSVVPVSATPTGPVPLMPLGALSIDVLVALLGSSITPPPWDAGGAPADPPDVWAGCSTGAVTAARSSLV